MKELLAAIARRTQATAEPYATAYADANRLFSVQLVRPATEPGFDRRLGEFKAQPKPLVFLGAARIRPLQPAAQIGLGDGPTYWGDLEITIGLGCTLEPRIDDLATVLTAPPGADESYLVGKNYRVVGIARGGHLSTGFALTCSGVQPSRFTHPL